ncbi:MULTISPECIES: ABC transporter permease [unclassified Campylobacter]|uniref:ABC transporter permease n=1 Tax=unclassified Campylobacter TaxID=2593542 RepID=UPI001CC21252|nr:MULTISPECIES: ABC transporter permease [unclassified Campylobacter]
MNIQAFKAFVKKEFFHIFRDTRTMMIVFLMPIVQILIFGFALSAEVNNINYAVFNPDKNIFTQKILEHFSKNIYFDFKKELFNKDEIQRVFNDNNIDLALIFENDFSKGANIQFLLDASDPNYASIVNLYASSVLQNAILSELKINNDSVINIHSTMLFNPSLKSAYNFVPGLLGLVLMLICAMMTSISIVREKEQGSMEILLVSPVKPIIMIMAKILPYFVISCISLGIVLLITIFVLEVKISGNIFFVIFYCMLFISLALSIGLLVSTLAKTQVVAMLVCALMFMLPVVLLSGMIFPVESMPLILQYISYVVPPRWFVAGIKKIMLEGLGFEFVLNEFLVLSFMLILVLFISIKNFNIRLEK